MSAITNADTANQLGKVALSSAPSEKLGFFIYYTVLRSSRDAPLVYVVALINYTVRGSPGAHFGGKPNAIITRLDS